MYTKEQGQPAKQRLNGDLQTLNFERLLPKFKSDIERYAAKYDEAWNDDFYQEGLIALHEASLNITLLPATRDFRPYALQAIKHRMIDFHRKNFKRSVKASNVTITNEDLDEEDFINTVTGDPEFFITTTFGTDYQIIFGEENLKAVGFNETEIKVFDLLLVQDYTVTRIAGELGLSVGRASKIVTKTKAKCQKTLIHMNKEKLKH